MGRKPIPLHCSERRTMHVHWHSFVHRDLAWSYYECRCGSREARKTHQGITGPKDRQWLAGGSFTTQAENRRKLSKLAMDWRDGRNS